MDNRSIVNPFIDYRTVIDKSYLSLGIQSAEKALLQGIIENLPCHGYWVNRNNVYLGCNEIQAKVVGLQSRDEIVGKTNFDFHDNDVAKKSDDINELVMSTGKAYEVKGSGYVQDCLTKKTPPRK